MRMARCTEHAKPEAPAKAASVQAPVEARREQQQAMAVTVVRDVEVRREDASTDLQLLICSCSILLLNTTTSLASHVSFFYS